MPMPTLERAVERALLPIAPLPAIRLPEVPSFVEYGTRRTLIVAGVMLAALLQTVDATIVNVALPTIQGNLGATVDEGAWVVTAYVVANVIVIPLTPWLQARFGRKTYFLVSIVGFTIASVLCGIATSFQALVLFRVVQGAFGGGLLPMAQVILRETFPARHLGTSQSIFSLGAVLGPSLGPTLGGIMTDNLSWQWVFDINVLPGAVAFVLLLAFLREGAKKSSPIDALGIGLLTATIASLQYVLDQGQRDDWFSSGGICIAAALAGISGAAFVWWELRTTLPIVDLRVLAQRGVAAACLVITGVAAGLYGVLLLLPQFTVTQLGFTSTLAGLLIGARALPIALLTIPVGRLANSNRIDLRILIGAGLLTAAVGSLWLSAGAVSSATLETLAAPLCLTGIGISFVFTPLLVCAQRAVPPSDAPKAAAFVTLWAQLGGSIAVACLVTLTDRRDAFHQDVLAGAVTRHNVVVAQFLATHSATQLYQLVAAQAATLSYADAFGVVGVISLVTIPFVGLLKGRA